MLAKLSGTISAGRCPRRAPAGTSFIYLLSLHNHLLSYICLLQAKLSRSEAPPSHLALLPHVLRSIIALISTCHFPPVVQAKLSSMVGTSSGYLESLPKPVRNRIAFLDVLQGRHDNIEENYQKEKAALEAKYRAMYGEDIT